MIQEALQKLLRGESLGRAEVEQVMAEVADGTATRSQVGAFLTALRMKGETAEELAGAAEVMRARVLRIRVDAPVFVDTCGTGGDGANTFNISTAAALVAAAAGVTVAKHGNRSVSSRCGSADVLAELGVDVSAPPERVERCIAEVGIGFLFAPHHHPAFKGVAEIRRELGFRTFFNLLGPLANPAGARHQVMGVFDARWVPVVGEVQARLGAAHALVVHGDGLDELSVTGVTQVCEVKQGSAPQSYELSPETLGLGRWTKAELSGGDAKENAAILRRVLDGEAGAPRDAVLANAAAALRVAGLADSWAQGVERSARAIDSGEALRRLERLVAVSRGAGA